LNTAADIPGFLQNNTDATTSVLLLFCKLLITQKFNTPIYKNIANINTQHCQPDHSVCLSSNNMNTEFSTIMFIPAEQRAEKQQTASGKRSSGVKPPKRFAI